jgi:hypothetical protein
MLTEAPSSGSASDGDVYGPSTSLDFSDHDGKKYWVRSGKQNFYMARYYARRDIKNLVSLTLCRPQAV